ncbi:MAG: 50S ribosomal protein L9 [Pseudomonadota bacterium]|nr:50S ribosomal protein L9 [Pseudomonadota bacterium]
MQVILLEKVENLGDLGDKVNVKPGFGRNFLIPKGKAAIANEENIALFEARRVELEAREASELTSAQKRANQLEALHVSIAAKVGAEGKLFGSIGTVDIAEACSLAGVDIQRSEVRLPDGPLRIVGQHSIELHLHSSVNVKILVDVIGDDSQNIDSVADSEE